jgi:hypothetical protein
LTETPASAFSQPILALSRVRAVLLGALFVSAWRLRRANQHASEVWLLSDQSGDVVINVLLNGDPDSMGFQTTAFLQKRPEKPSDRKPESLKFVQKIPVLLESGSFAFA